MKKRNGVLLTTEFFDRNEIIFIESMQGGDMVINILLKLYALYGADGGRLSLKDDKPVAQTFSMLAKVTRSRCIDIRRTIEVLLEKGIVKEKDNELYLLPCYQDENPFSEWVGKGE